MMFNLCSGYGRFASDDDQEISIDIDPKTNPTIIADVRYLPLRPGLHAEKVIASPPCTYVCSPRRWRYGFNPSGVAESFEIAAACYRAFVYLDAELCIFEMAGIEEMMGHRITFRYDKHDIKNARTTFHSNRKGLLRAQYPKWVRETILEAVTREGAGEKA